MIQPILESFEQQITTEDLIKYTKSSNYIKEFEIPVGQLGLKGITTDSNGNVWFYHSSNSSGKIIKMNSDVKFEQYDISGKTKVPNFVVQLAGGQLVFDETRNIIWFTDARTNSIGKLDEKTGQIQMMEIPTEKAGPMGITLSNDKKIVWFTEILASKIAKLDINSDKITEYPTGRDTGPTFLIFDKDGILWVTQSYSHNILRIQPDLLDSVLVNAMNPITLPKSETFSPFGIAIVQSGGQQKLIVSDHGSSRVVLSDLDKNLETFTSYWTTLSQVYPQTLPGQIVADKSGNVYFPQHGGNRISKINTSSGLMTEYEIPTGPLSTVLFAAISDDGSKVWFTEWASNKIGYLDTTIDFPYQLTVHDNQITLDKAKPKIISAQIQAENAIESRQVEIGLAGMTDSSIVGIAYDANPKRTILNATQNTDVEFALSVQDNARPDSYDIMATATSLENDQLAVSALYPISITLDVPGPMHTKTLEPKDSASSNQIEQNTMTRYLALSVAAALIVFLIYSRIKRAKNKPDKK